jgi:hypothetical protein
MMSATRSAESRVATDLVCIAGSVSLRAGGKPLRFKGTLLAEASSRRPGAKAWHEITVYAEDCGGYAAGLRLCALPPLAGTDRAARFPTLDALADWLEKHDPSADLQAGFDVADPTATGADLAVKAAALRDRAEDLRRAYRALIGELLYQLDTEPAS